tara:strand:+ start:293 stop:439 length:147 start_codon:yes stop_codon:yes gene_type:complete
VQTKVAVTNKSRVPRKKSECLFEERQWMKGEGGKYLLDGIFDCCEDIL